MTTTPFGGFGSAQAQSNALVNALVQARQQNPAYFSNISSGYLLSDVQRGTLSPQQFATVATASPTGTFLVSSQPFAGSQRSQSSVTAGILQAVSSGGVVDAPTLTPYFQSSGTTNNGVADAFNTGIHEIGSFFTNHPLALLALGGLAFFLVVKR